MNNLPCGKNTTPEIVKDPLPNLKMEHLRAKLRKPKPPQGEDEDAKAPKVGEAAVAKERAVSGQYHGKQQLRAFSADEIHESLHAISHIKFSVGLLRCSEHEDVATPPYYLQLVRELVFVSPIV